MTKLDESEERRIEAERKRFDLTQEEENKICLFGDNIGCVTLPGIGGISTGLLLLGLGLGILCGCYGSRCCNILTCCFPCCFRKSADLQAPEDYQDINDVNITIDNDKDSVCDEEEKQDNDDPICDEEKQDLKDDSIEV